MTELTLMLIIWILGHALLKIFFIKKFNLNMDVLFGPIPFFLFLVETNLLLFYKKVENIDQECYILTRVDQDYSRG
jgi:hypothetical protein